MHCADDDHVPLADFDPKTHCRAISNFGKLPAMGTDGRETNKKN
jgi:hypothetical protein